MGTDTMEGRERQDMMHRTTIQSGWEEVWVLTYDGMTGIAKIRNGSWQETLGGAGLRFRSWRDAQAYALANISPNPNWSPQRKALAEYGQTVTGVKSHEAVKAALLKGAAH